MQSNLTPSLENQTPTLSSAPALPVWSYGLEAQNTSLSETKATMIYVSVRLMASLSAINS